MSRNTKYLSCYSVHVAVFIIVMILTGTIFITKTSKVLILGTFLLLLEVEDSLIQLMDPSSPANVYTHTHTQRKCNHETDSKIKVVQMILHSHETGKFA